MTLQSAPPPSPATAFPSFTPLGLDSIVGLSEKTRCALAWDLAEAKDCARLRAMEAFIPFAKPSKSLDVALCARVLSVADAAWTEPLIARFETLYAAGSRQLHHDQYSRSDFGSLATAFAMEALAERLATPEKPLSAHGRQRLDAAIRLARSPTLPIGSYLGSSASELSYGFLSQPEAVSDLCDDELERLGIAYIRPTLPSVALAWAAQGDPELLAAMLARPDSVDKVGSVALAEYRGHDGRQGEYKVLYNHNFWMHAPAVGFQLIDMARSMRGCEDLAIQDRVVGAIIQSAKGDPDNWALREALERCGVDIFAKIFNGSTPAGDLFEHVVALAAADEIFEPACRRLMALAFDLAKPIRGVDTGARHRCLRSALFSPLPGVAEMAQQAWAQNQPAEPDPYVACLRSANIERQIEAICHCGRPELVARGLDAIGIEMAQSFPGHRKGLDSSLGMWVAHKAPLHIFQAALDWFAAHDGLEAQASAKAWVYQGHETRKKGDLLADCVARGDLDQARALLAMLPGADTKPAREVAKAMASKVSGSAGGIALSAWETLLLGKVLQAHRDKTQPDEPPEPPKRAHRL